MNEETKNEQQEHSLFVKQMLEVEVFPNLSQQVIMTTEDRLKLCLQENLKKAERKNDWITPFSLLIAIITAFVTATFKDFIVSAKTWEAIFILVGVNKHKGVGRRSHQLAVVLLLLHTWRHRR